MKIRKTISFLIMLTGYLFFFGAIFVFFGTIGAHENGAITYGQLFNGIFTSTVMAVASVIIYVVRDWFNHYFIKLPTIRANRVR